MFQMVDNSLLNYLFLRDTIFDAVAFDIYTIIFVCNQIKAVLQMGITL